jgi:methionine-gamma-lyase
MHPQTSSVSEGFDPALSVMAVRPPIYPVSTYCFPNAAAAAHHFSVLLGKTDALPGEKMGLVYARLNHPNAEMFEEGLRSIERGAQAAAVFTSGMAAITTMLFALARPGQVILYQRPVYGGTDHVFTSLLPQWNVRAVAVEHGRWGEALAAHAGDIALVYLETPANPTLEMIDLGAVREAIDGACPDRRVPMVVDNTFLGPVFQSPLEHGADLVVYSATKFLGGHSDLVAGALTARDPAWIQQVKGLRAFLGTICEPFTAWMLQRSLATLWLRMTRQSKNAARLVNVLRGHRAVAHIHYPTLFVGEQARIFQKQCRAPGLDDRPRPPRRAGGRVSVSRRAQARAPRGVARGRRVARVAPPQHDGVGDERRRPPPRGRHRRARAHLHRRRVLARPRPRPHAGPRRRRGLIAPRAPEGPPPHALHRKREKCAIDIFLLTARQPAVDCTVTVAFCAPWRDKTSGRGHWRVPEWRRIRVRSWATSAASCVSRP